MDSNTRSVEVFNLSADDRSTAEPAITCAALNCEKKTTLKVRVPVGNDQVVVLDVCQKCKGIFV